MKGSGAKSEISREKYIEIRWTVGRILMVDVSSIFPVILETRWNWQSDDLFTWFLDSSLKCTIDLLTLLLLLSLSLIIIDFLIEDITLKMSITLKILWGIQSSAKEYNFSQYQKHRFFLTSTLVRVALNGISIYFDCACDDLMAWERFVIKDDTAKNRINFSSIKLHNLAFPIFPLLRKISYETNLKRETSVYKFLYFRKTKAESLELSESNFRLELIDTVSNTVVLPSPQNDRVKRIQAILLKKE